MRFHVSLCLRARGSSRNCFLSPFLNNIPLSLKIYGKKSPDYDRVIHEQGEQLKRYRDTIDEWKHHGTEYGHDGSEKLHTPCEDDPPPARAPQLPVDFAQRR